MNDEIATKGLELYNAELIKCMNKAVVKREKELIKLHKKNKELDGLTEYDLEDMYGYSMFSYAVYQDKLKELREYHESKIALKDVKTPLTEYIRMIGNEIHDITEEISMIKEGEL